MGMCFPCFKSSSTDLVTPDLVRIYNLVLKHEGGNKCKLQKRGGLIKKIVVLKIRKNSGLSNRGDWN
ncbi:hypothetical protein C0J52_00923 [Blattella germanica]|nr:hypothetical protein C0J52_00923 [Blattella germanica]